MKTWKPVAIQYIIIHYTLLKWMYQNTLVYTMLVRKFPRFHTFKIVQSIHPPCKKCLSPIGNVCLWRHQYSIQWLLSTLIFRGVYTYHIHTHPLYSYTSCMRYSGLHYSFFWRQQPTSQWMNLCSWFSAQSRVVSGAYFNVIWWPKNRAPNQFPMISDYDH